MILPLSKFLLACVNILIIYLNYSPFGTYSGAAGAQNMPHPYEKLKASLKLISQLAQREQDGKEKGWMTIEEVEVDLGIENV